MITTDFAAKRRTKKERSCSKGYNCGNSCIAKALKCRRKFSDQASHYAGWLKKQEQKTPSNSIKAPSKLGSTANKVVKEQRGKTLVEDKKPEDTKTKPENVLSLEEAEVYLKSLGEGVEGAVFLDKSGDPAQALKYATKRYVKNLGQGLEIQRELAYLGISPKITQELKTWEEQDSQGNPRPLGVLGMEFVDGSAVSLKDPKQADSALSAIFEMHKKAISHNDLHSENMMIDKTGAAKIIDLSRAKKGSKAAVIDEAVNSSSVVSQLVKNSSMKNVKKALAEIEDRRSGMSREDLSSEAKNGDLYDAYMAAFEKDMKAYKKSNR